MYKIYLFFNESNHPQFMIQPHQQQDIYEQKIILQNVLVLKIDDKGQVLKDKLGNVLTEVKVEERIEHNVIGTEWVPIYRHESQVSVNQLDIEGNPILNDLGVPVKTPNFKKVEYINVPEGAVEITQEQWDEYILAMSNQKTLSLVNGTVEIIDK